MSTPKLSQVGVGNSFFEFIEKFCLSDKTLQRTNRAVHRLCSLMRKMDVKTVVVENLVPSSSYIHDEYLALKKHYSKDILIKAYKFTFISKRITALAQIPELKDDNFLSSVIIINFKDPKRKDWISYIYKAIVTIPKMPSELGIFPLLNNYCHTNKTFPCEVGISDIDKHKFMIHGTFFCQQNTVTSVCGHASLCMAINNMNLGKISMLSTEDINKIIGADHINRKFGSGLGLDKNDIYKVLNHFKLNFTEFDFFAMPYLEYANEIYKYIESRNPVLLILSTYSALHMVTVLGHTLNSDIWQPEAQFLYANQILPQEYINYKLSAAWVDHFIIHDDNFGMYLCMPVGALKRVTIPQYDPTFRAKWAFMITPNGITVDSTEAELASVVVLKHILQTYVTNVGSLTKWLHRIIAYDNMKPARPTVVRTFLVTKDDYAKSLDATDFEGNTFSETDKSHLMQNLPFYFWLSEITLPDIYTTNKTKLIDFFYSAEYPKADNLEDVYHRWIQIRFPDALLVRNGNSSHSVYDMNIKSHYPLLRFETDQNTLDW